MNRSVSRLLPLVLLLFTASAARAQVVRGTVSDRSSGAPLAGVLVTLDRADGVTSESSGTVASGLTNQRGEYAVRAPGAGTYRLSAKRIGVQRYASESFSLGAGETRRLDVVLDPALQRLPEVRVSAPAICVANESGLVQVVALWDEAHTALTANQVSLRDRLYEGRVSRYVRELDPKSLRVLSEARSETQGIMDRPFTDLDADSLSRVGYWHPAPDGLTVRYHLPDAAVLVSAAFRRDHCFSIAAARRERRNLTGLAFEPVAKEGRVTADVRGVLWLDERTFELRLVEFHYTGMTPSDERMGGELHFARLANGAWVVRRWFVRMPRARGYASPPVGVEGRVPSVLVRPGAERVVEEGAELFVTEGGPSPSVEHSGGVDGRAPRDQVRYSWRGHGLHRRSHG
jgi:hypothetical protein